MPADQTNPTGRFSSRVEDYVKYRPGYPEAVADLLSDQYGLQAGSVVADIGSGTGILAEMLLRRGCRVRGVEPNNEMRRAGERLLAGYPEFVSVNATAENTTLAPGSVDLVTAGQAFHWFEAGRAKAEFARILRPGGHCLLVWNSRRTLSTPFLRDYEALLLRFGTDYQQINHRNIDAERLRGFFRDGSFATATFYNGQTVDYDGLRGRLLSSSYVPDSGHPDYHPMLHDLRAIFERHQTGGCITIEYDTEVFCGKP